MHFALHRQVVNEKLIGRLLEMKQGHIRLFKKTLRMG